MCWGVWLLDISSVVADISDPSWRVVECLAGGKLEISISYQVSTNVTKQPDPHVSLMAANVSSQPLQLHPLSLWRQLLS